MSKRQTFLRKKLAVYREQLREAEEQTAIEQQRLKTVMETEIARQKEVEALRRKKLKEKISEYRKRVEQERVEAVARNQNIELMSKADRRKKIQEHLRKKNEAALANGRASLRPGRGNNSASPSTDHTRGPIYKSRIGGKVSNSDSKKGEGMRRSSRHMDLLRDDCEPSPTDLGNTLDSPLGKTQNSLAHDSEVVEAEEIGKGRKGTPRAEAEERRGDGDEEAELYINGAKGAEVQEDGNGGREGHDEQAAALADVEDRKQGNVANAVDATIGENGGEEGPVDGVIEIEGQQQKILSPGGKEETWVATEGDVE